MQNFSPIKKRILQYIEYKHISKYKFYQETGITRGVLDKDSGISEDNIAKFIAYDKTINLEWLLTGVGEMIKRETVSNESQAKIYSNDKDEYIIRLQREKIESLEKEIKLLKKECAKASNYGVTTKSCEKLKK
ncbi:hypothetical protein APS56_08425 [Pseudalgibacter alginicilyticus]|uniref:HTH cro/C1-type domain-containing protein n=1 Tax=Pseudalgibacter alginicilyticus TaxID=1736674 RepID=A0A0P0CGA9_9FLAO|nr:hypothetical protein [Pseudalgibacter alginicilyticus]ALJ05147.1 hypothetical protein APS56_08425 [Pseudalgibacter alginicilyticus]